MSVAKTTRAALRLAPSSVVLVYDELSSDAATYDVHISGEYIGTITTKGMAALARVYPSLSTLMRRMSSEDRLRARTGDWPSQPVRGLYKVQPGDRMRVLQPGAGFVSFP